MPFIPPIWVLACRASGRFDPWPVLSALGGAEAVDRASPVALRKAGVPAALLERLPDVRPLETDQAWVRAGAAGYPAALREVPYAPPVLFYEGELAILNRPTVAIVGSRGCTATGRQVAARLARAVGQAGGVVVSGLAVGVDQAAHLEACAGGGTVGVLGLGIQARDRPGTLRLRRRIVETGGLLLSEFLPDDPPSGFTFLQRNRVIAALSRITVVVEAASRSGALSTARHALAAGREVLAVPGPMDGPTVQGCLDLLEAGATMVRSPGTVLRAAGLAEVAEGRTIPLLASSRALGDALQAGGTVDQLAARANLTSVEALRLLSELELTGLVRREPGQRYAWR